MIDTETKFFFSISSNTSNRGARFYNKLFKKLKKNLVYIPVSILSNKKFDEFFKFLKDKNLNFIGSSVSMPFKERVLKFIDEKDKSVIKSKNANTIVLRKKKIKAFNTDFMAASLFLKKNYTKNILLIGSGALSKSFLASGQNQNFFIYNRSKKKFLKLKSEFRNVKLASDKSFLKCQAVSIINCTPKNSNRLKDFIKKININHIKCIIDCSITKNFSYLKDIATRSRIVYINGENFYKTQRNFQKKIYLSI